nr:MAG TPA: hypothetical protein [Caudoviricetes sp.]
MITMLIILCKLMILMFDLFVNICVNAANVIVYFIEMIVEKLFKE